MNTVIAFTLGFGPSVLAFVGVLLLLNGLKHNVARAKVRTKIGYVLILVAIVLDFLAVVLS